MAMGPDCAGLCAPRGFEVRLAFLRRAFNEELHESVELLPPRCSRSIGLVERLADDFTRVEVREFFDREPDSAYSGLVRKSLVARWAVALAFLAGATPTNVSLCRFVDSGPRPPDVSQFYGCDLSFTAVIEAARVVERRINTCGHPDLEPLEEARR